MFCYSYTGIRIDGIVPKECAHYLAFHSYDVTSVSHLCEHRYTRTQPNALVVYNFKV